jgi:hypothetical protein
MAESQRLEYFLDQALDQELVWFLEKDSQALCFALSDGKLALPIFPRQELAALEAADASESPKALALEEFLDGMLPDLARLGRLVAVFPVAGKAWLEEPLALQAKIWERWDEGD